MTKDAPGTRLPFDTEPDGPSESGNILSNPANWPIAYHTIKNMKPVQVAGIIERQARHAVIPRLPVDFDERYERRVPETLSTNTEAICQNLLKLQDELSDRERRRYRARFTEMLEGRYTFLGRTIEFEGGIDWEHEKLEMYPLLWQLKLQSFMHLEWLLFGYASPSAAPECGAQLERQIAAWVMANPIGESQYLRRSWIPHSVSLRILNWSRYAAWVSQTETAQALGRLYRQIYKNALFLSNHIEHEVGGNHLIENAIGLIIAGVLFQAHDTGWIEQGMKLLQQAGDDQFLADGGHFERSPMYHLMVLRRYATAYDLVADHGGSSTRIKRTAERALGFLSEIVGPDGTIPLLNDAVYGEQIEAQTCLAYADACALTPRAVSLDHPSGSGYRKLTSDAGTLLIDCGEVGPPHLPAHSHNDQLSVLLWVDGYPLLADTGVYDYAPTPRRQFARSVRAHNTAQCGDVEPIPIAGRYLMGKRTSTEIDHAGERSIRATCQRTPIVGTAYEHEREIESTAGTWQIADEIRSQSENAVTVRFHFHPAVTVRATAKDTDGYVCCVDNGALAEIRFPSDVDCELTRSVIFEQYGRERYRPMIEVTARTNEPILTRISSLRTSNETEPRDNRTRAGASGR
jgi:uncharacterized heparinase superfamily protein